MEWNLKGKLVAHGSKPPNLWGRQVGLEKQTLKIKLIQISQLLRESRVVFSQPVFWGTQVHG